MTSLYYFTTCLRKWLVDSLTCGPKLVPRLDRNKINFSTSIVSKKNRKNEKSCVQIFLDFFLTFLIMLISFIKLLVNDNKNESNIIPQYFIE